MHSVVFVVIVFCWLESAVGSQTFCVAPPPLDQGCRTIDYYANHKIIDNSEFVFLPGIHNLTRSLWIHAVSNVTFAAHEDAEGNVTIECFASNGIIFQHVTNLILENLSFVSCGQQLPDSLQRYNETAQAAIAFGEVTDLRLQSVSVSHSHGYGILGHCVHGNFVITESCFFSNKGGALYLGGNVAVEYTNCSKPKNGVSNSLSISYSQFIDGGYDDGRNAFTKYSGTLATGLMMILSQTNTTVWITDVTMQGNTNSLVKPGFGGNLFIHFFNDTSTTSNSVTVQNSKFLDGVAYTGGGISASFHTDPNGIECRNHLTIRNTIISQNHAILGGGLYIDFQLKYYDQAGPCPDTTLRITNCTFERNIQIQRQNIHKTNYLGNGVAVHLANTVFNNRLVHQAGKHFKAFFEDCIFQSSVRDRSMEWNGSTQMTVGGFSFVLANGDVKITDCKFINNEFTALGGYRAKITLAGDILMSNNTGMNGGGLILCESSYMVLSRNTHLRLIDNYATVSGGGIYIEGGCPFTDPFCPIQIDVFALNCSEVSEVANVLMINNTAGYAGDHIYGGSFDHCKQNTCSKTDNIFNSLFSILPNATSGRPHLSAVTSDPEKVCFCIEDKIDCKLEIIHYSEELFPGERATFGVVIVGQFDGTVPGTLLVHSEDAEDIIIQTNRYCRTLHIPATSNNKTTATIKVHLASRPLSSRNMSLLVSLTQLIQVHVTLKLCPPGFEYSGGKCDCIKKLKRNKVHCDITSQTVTRSPPAWIGYVNGTEESSGIVYHNPCPYDYCVDVEVNITSNETGFHQDLQCGSDRTGFMCSKCRPGFSESIGSSSCLQCRTRLALPLSIVGYLVYGILFVFFLALLNITYTDGMLSGLVFYLHVINLNSSTFLPRQHVHPLFFILISWQGLSGLNYCLYDGMDSYAKAWLWFLFPNYYFAITAVIILLSRRFKRFSRLFGKNIIKVLATLFLLSFSQLVDAVVRVLSFTPVHYASTDVRKIVWLSDPTLMYFGGKHFPLVLVAIVFALLILAYTLVLLFIQPLQRYSHLRCFSWVARLKPLVDAYTAPHVIRDSCRYWEGLLLFFRLILAVFFAVNIYSTTASTNLVVIIFVCVLLLTVSWSVGGVYKKPYLNVLNSSFVLNLAALSLAIYYTSSKYDPKTNTRYFQYIVYTSYSLFLLTGAGVIVCHVYFQARRWYSACRRYRRVEAPAENDDNDILSNLREF